MFGRVMDGKGSPKTKAARAATTAAIVNCGWLMIDEMAGRGRIRA